MLDDKTVSLAVDAASKYNLPASLVKSIIMVESAGKANAERFEPAFKERYIDPRPWPTFGLPLPDEYRQRATSCGLMQVMGQVAREFGMKDPDIKGALTTPAVGIDYGCKLLARLSKKYDGRADKWQAVCAAYNGGPGAVKGVNIYSNPKYPAKVAYQLSLLGLSLDDGWTALDGEVA